jgi:Uma2 family endonuclease
MPAPPRSPATWEDLLDLPEGTLGEIVAGELVLQPRPADPHNGAQTNLQTLLGGPFRFGQGGPGGWVFRVEPYIAFGADVRAPDLAGWRRERFTRPRKGPLTVVPDWICEVLCAESTAATDRSEKMPLYAAHGVRHLWLVDPEIRTVEVYRLLERKWLVLDTFRGDAEVRAEPFEAIELCLAPSGTRTPDAAHPIANSAYRSHCVHRLPVGSVCSRSA